MEEEKRKKEEKARESLTMDKGLGGQPAEIPALIPMISMNRSNSNKINNNNL